MHTVVAVNNKRKVSEDYSIKGKGAYEGHSEFKQVHE